MSVDLLFEVFLSNAAKRAFPVIGKIREQGSGLDAVIRIAEIFVIDVSANCALKFRHSVFSFTEIIRYLHDIIIAKGFGACNGIYDMIIANGRLQQNVSVFWRFKAYHLLTPTTFWRIILFIGFIDHL